MTLHPLDEDPERAAHAHADAHLRRAVGDVANCLSCAWHWLHNPAHLNEGDPAARPGVFVTLARPASSRAEPHPTIQADGPFSVADGAVAYLFNGQRIGAGVYGRDVWPTWARLCTGNYRWTWRLGVALAEEYGWRFGRVHPGVHAVRALEPLPARLAESPDGLPLYPFPYALPDGYWREDPVDSYRAHYAEGRAAELTYTRREPPEWLR